MRRIVLCCCIGIGLLVWPSLAAAKSYPIYDNSHHRAGSAAILYATTDPADSSKALAEVWQNTTMVRYCGKVTYGWGEEGLMPGFYDLWDMYGAKMDPQRWIHKASARQFEIWQWSVNSAKWVTLAKAIKGASGPWKLFKRVKGKLVMKGTVPRGCPGYGALGGGYLLKLL